MSVSQRLAELIAVDTQNPGGDEEGMCHLLADALRHAGADDVVVETVPRDGQTGAYVFARFGTPRLLVNAHVDTVPAQPTWSHPPHTAQVTEDRVVGLGSADTKGAIAAIVCALNHTRPKDVGILFSGDEEAGTTVAEAFLASAHPASIERAIVCEPTTRCVGVRHRGICAYRATFEGEGGHSSLADSLPKPIVLAAELSLGLDRLGRQYEAVGPEGMRGLCMNVADISGGVAFNVIPDQVQVTWSTRPPPGCPPDEVEREQEILCQTLGATTETLIRRGGFACEDPSAFANLLGTEIPHVGLQFWTEAALFRDVGIDCVVLGPGEITQAHAADEYVTVADLEWAQHLFESVFARSHDAG